MADSQSGFACETQHPGTDDDGGFVCRAADLRAALGLLSRHPKGGPVHLQLLNGGVVNLTSTADEEHHVFLAGRFECFPNTDGNSSACSDFLKPGRSGQAFALRVIEQSIEGLFRLVGQFRVTALYPPDSAGREYVLAFDDGIENKAACGFSHGPNREASNHKSLPLIFCEGPSVAQTVAAAMARA